MSFIPPKADPRNGPTWMRYKLYNVAQSKSQDRQRTNLFYEDCDNFCLMAPCILPDSFLAAVSHWKLIFFMSRLKMDISPLSSIHSEELSIIPRFAANPLLQEYCSTTTPVTKMACRQPWDTAVAAVKWLWFCLHCLLHSGEALCKLPPQTRSGATLC